MSTQKSRQLNEYPNEHQGLFFEDVVRSAAVGKTVAELTSEPSSKTPREPIVKLLTLCERQVFAHMLKGMSNKEIAIALDGTNQYTGGSISHRTIEDHRQNIKAKLGARTSTEAVMMGIREIVGDEAISRYLATLLPSASKSP